MKERIISKFILKKMIRVMRYESGGRRRTRLFCCEKVIEFFEFHQM
jgi:hypothetical protein